MQIDPEIQNYDELRHKAEILAVLSRDAGERYARCRFANFAASTSRQESVKRFVLEWASTFATHKANLILFGAVGTGKDHLAFAAARMIVLAQGVSAVWVNGRELQSAARDFSKDSDGWLENACLSAELLVLSDPLPARGTLTDWQADVLYRIIERRDANKRPTICTVNVASDEVADAMIGAPTWDRLCHGAWKVQCNWPTHRRPARIG